MALSTYNARDVVKELVTHQISATTASKIEDGLQKLKDSTTATIGGGLQKLKESTTSKLEDGLQKLYTSMIKQNEDMLSMQNYILSNIKNSMSKLEDKLADLEEEITHSNTDRDKPSNTTGRNTLYADENERLNTIEINGIPLIEDQQQLQSVVRDILQQIGCTVESTDFEACYQIPDPSNNGMPAPTICRFSKRNICRLAHRNKKSLRGVKVENINSKELYINDYLCWYYKKLAAKCRRLKKRKDISDTWTFKGIVKIRLLNESVRSIKHQVDLDRLFPNYSYFD